MEKFAIGNQRKWCQACGNSTGVCSKLVASSSSRNDARAGSHSGKGISKAVAGVIGALVTLAVILGAEALVMLTAGLRVVNKKRLQAGVVSPKA